MERTTTNFRALCAELTDALHKHTCLYGGYENELVARSRAALEQPDEEGPPVTKRQIMMLADELGLNDLSGSVRLVQEVLRRWSPPHSSQSDLEEPTDENAEQRSAQFDPNSEERQNENPNVVELYNRYQEEIDKSVNEALSNWGTRGS